MRRGLMVMAGVAIVATVAFFALRPASTEDETTPQVAEPTFTPVSVLATAGDGLTLTGVVRDSAGTPVRGAQVFLAASSQQSLTQARCGVCNEPLLSCRAHETHRRVAAMLEAHEGSLTAALTAQSDEAGEFRFTHLAGTSFTVWAQAAGHGMGLRERAAPGENAEVSLPAPRVLSGQVASEGGGPLAAKVTIMSRRLADPIAVQADAQGHFTAEGLGEGPFYVAATAPGHVPAVMAQAEGGSHEVRLCLARARRLEVHLVSGGKPIDGVVRLQGWHLSREVHAKDGLAIIDGLYPDELIVSAFTKRLSSAPVSVPLKQLESSVTLQLEPGGTLAVTVIDEAGQPVAEPTLDLLTRGSELVVSRTLKTGELGVLGPLGVGDYQLRTSAPNFEPTTMPVTVTAKETSLEVTLSRGAIIAGRVIDEYGRPAPGVSVLLSPTSEVAVSDHDGHFHASVPSPGLYTLQAHHSDWGGGELKVTAPKTDVELHLEPKAGVEVTVLADGRRVEGASVMLYHSTGNYRSDRPSGADGVVLMRGLQPDTYKVVATHPEFLPSELQTLTLQEGPSAHSTVTLRQGAAVTGQVVDTDGAPVPQVLVSIGPRAAEPTTTDAQGNFRIGPLRPKGVYAVKVVQKGFESTTGSTLATAGGEKVRVVVKRQLVFHGRVLGEGQPLKSFRVSETEVTSSDGTFDLPLPATSGHVIVTVEAPGFDPLTDDRPNAPDLGVFDLKRAPQVKGLVRDEVTGPVADAVVTCDSCEQSVTTGPDGTFTIGRPALQHDFTLVAKKGRRSASKQVAQGTVDGLELVLKPAVKVTGTAYLANGQPAAGVEITGLQVERMEPVSAVTNADGTYSLEAPPGLNRLTLMTPESMTRSVEPMTTIIDLRDPQTTLDFGPAPGTASLGVVLKPQPGYALWLVRGEVTSVGDPPMELLHSAWAQLVYFPRTERVVFGGLAPGRYTVVWADFHAGSSGGPLLIPVSVPSAGDVSVVR